MLFRRRRPPPDVLWALDLETDGLDARRGVILSVGMVPVRAGAVHVGEAYESRVRPPRVGGLDEDAIRIHHLVPEDLREAPAIEEVVPEIGRRLREGGLLVHHAAVDVPFLRRAFQVCATAWPDPWIVDTVDLILRLERRRQYVDPSVGELPQQLPAIRERLLLPPHSAHDALSDAVATAELYLVLSARLGA